MPDKMLQVFATAQAPRPTLVLTPATRWLDFGLGDLWRYRELLYFLAWRDIKVRYKQTVLGIAWAALQPLMTVAMFTIIFEKIAKLPSGGVPYPLFVLTGLLPYQFFAFSLSNASDSLVGNQSLVSRVYFPRLVIPIAATLPAIADFFISALVLLGMMLFWKTPLGPRLIAIPALLLLAMASALGVSLWLSALNVQYRDVRYVVPFLATMWQYATPIGYSETLIPTRLRWLYGLNPMTGVVTGFRWSLLGVGQISEAVWISTAMVGLLLVSGLVYFRRMESTFADVI